MDKISIFWFRRDLRLHDNKGFFRALQSEEKILPIFIFDIEINNLKDFTNLISELKARSLNFKIIRNRKASQLNVN